MFVVSVPHTYLSDSIALVIHPPPGLGITGETPDLLSCSSVLLVGQAEMIYLGGLKGSVDSIPISAIWRSPFDLI